MIVDKIKNIDTYSNFLIIPQRYFPSTFVVCSYLLDYCKYLFMVPNENSPYLIECNQQFLVVQTF